MAFLLAKFEKERLGSTIFRAAFMAYKLMRATEE